MTRPSRDGLEPGMIVEHRQRYVVTDQRYPDESLKHAGQLKLRPVGDVEQVAIAYADPDGVRTDRRGGGAMKKKRVIYPGENKWFRQRIWRWLLANGCRDIVALEPVIIHYTKRGKIIEYQALCRQGRLDNIKVKRGQPVSKRKRMWLRHEFSEVE